MQPSDHYLVANSQMAVTALGAAVAGFNPAWLFLLVAFLITLVTLAGNKLKGGRMDTNNSGKIFPNRVVQVATKCKRIGSQVMGEFLVVLAAIAASITAGFAGQFA